MRFAVAVAMLAWAAQFSGPAAADLYRWVDPETGSIKFSSYPPPWYGDPAKERRAPKIEVIPERSSAPSSGPKPEELARPEIARPGPGSAEPRSAEPGSAEKPAERSADRRVDKTPDGPAGKSAANPEAKREPAPLKDKDGSVDGR